MAKLRKKGEVGSKKVFINRDKAIKKLQLSIKDFRRICIIKGIYPVEPAKKNKITKSSKKKTYYLSQDIQYLKNEPLLWKFWEFKSYLKKITKCKGRGEYDMLNKVSKTKPSMKFDHVLKERYPKFTDALRDIDDALCMCFLYANLTKSEKLPGQVIKYSRRLISEFMHYVIETHSLRKVFISIKGIYFQVQIMGQLITFIMPHKFSLFEQQDIDYSVMRTFTEFYITLLGFVNYKLLTSANFHYPPKVTIPVKNNEKVNYTIGSSKLDKQEEYIACLNQPLFKTVSCDAIEEEENLDYFEDYNEYNDHVKFIKLFKNFKFYLNREVPKEALVFIIRSFGGKVSWDKYLGVGSTYDENDESITHQIVDRNSVEKKFINRQYVQPQWIFDSVNAKKLLPIEDYFPGVDLPPHLSPFVEEKEGDYVPEEKEALKKYGSLKAKENKEEDESSEIDSSDDDDGEEKINTSIEENDSEDNIDINSEDNIGIDSEDNQKIETKKTNLKKQNNKNKKTKNEVKKVKLDMKVESGKVKKENLSIKKTNKDLEERKLSEMMIPRKKKRLYQKIMKYQAHKKEDTEKLKLKKKRLSKMKKNVKTI